MKTLPPINQWLDQFAACVRNRDLPGGRALFAPEVHGFGTRTEEARNLAELVQHQWSRVWFHTRGFRFLKDSVVEFAAADGSLLGVLALWDSEGLDAAGNVFPRRGRCTVLLRPDAASPAGYVALHTHFSKTPPDEL